MAVRNSKFTQLALVGANGSAAGTAVSPFPLNGELMAIKVVQGNTPAATTDIVFTVTDGLTSNVILTISNSSTASKWYYPRALAQGVDGADLTGWYTQIPLNGTVSAVVAQGNSAATVDITIQYEEYSD